MSTKSRVKEIPLIELFEQFISDTKNGKRLQTDGRRIGPGTVANYVYTFKLLRSFSNERAFYLRIKPIRFLNGRQLETEKNYWKRFYLKFTDYLYRQRGHFDNYVGQTIKNIRVFFNYLNKELVLGVGEYHKHFYVRKEEIPIFPLSPDELSFLINDKLFEEGLNKRLRETKDFFVFGCTVGLRLSDLLALKKSNIRLVNGQQYLVVRSIKTKTDSLIKLPPYASGIIARYSRRKKLLPVFNKSNINKYIKILLEKAGFTHPVQKVRERKGATVEIKNTSGSTHTRLCDLASSHTMRRTAITTMLNLGVPEQIVRKISGHAPASKEFYRYVLWAQAYQDRETERGFERLQEQFLNEHRS